MRTQETAGGKFTTGEHSLQDFQLSFFFPPAMNRENPRLCKIAHALPQTPSGLHLWKVWKQRVTFELEFILSQSCWTGAQFCRESSLPA